MTLRLGELCAGYGGLGMAVEEVFNAETAWFSEFDAAPSKILAHHWPDVPNYGDMTAIDWAAIEHVDIISGGTPCQDLSAAGRRAGMTEGTRSNLWVQMREAVAIQRPKYVVWENVRGAFSAEASSDLEQCPGCVGDTSDGRVFLRALGRVLGDLSDLGYDTEWRGLRASDVGAPHARFRVFVLARRRGAPAHARSVGGNQAEQHHGSGAPADDRPGVPDESDRDAMRPGPFGEASTNSDHLGSDWGRERPKQDGRGQSEDRRITSADAESLGRREGRAESARFERGLSTPGDSAPVADPASARRTEGEDGGTSVCHACQRPWSSESERVGGERVVTPSDAISGGRDGWAREARREAGERIAAERTSESAQWGDYAPAIHRWERAIGRPAPRPTEPTGRNHGERLSPHFTEWMMGLPGGWVTDSAIGITRNEQLKACGNGVVPQQATAALRDMFAAFEMEVAA